MLSTFTTTRPRVRAGRTDHSRREMLALAPCLLLARSGLPPPLKSTQFITARTAGFVSAADGDGGDCIFDADSWRAAANWDPLNSFERSKLLRALLDGDLDVRECNHAAWRGLGYTLGADGSLCDADGEPVPPDVPLPNVMCDDAWLAKLQSKLPDAESGSVEDEDAVEQLNTVVETLHGEKLTQLLIEEEDEDFLARRTLVQWLYWTQDALKLK